MAGIDLGEVMSRSYRLLADNPIILVPFLIMGLIGAVTGVLFSFATMNVFMEFAEGATNPNFIPAAIMQLTAAVMLISVAMGIINTILSAGAVAMMYEAMKKGRTTLNTLSEGVVRGLIAFVASVLLWVLFVVLCLVGAVFVVILMALSPLLGGLAAVVVVISLIATLFIVLFMTAYIVPVSVRDKKGVGEILTRSYEFAMQNKINTFAAFIIIIIIGLFVSLPFSLFGASTYTSVKMGDTPGMMNVMKPSGIIVQGVGALIQSLLVGSYSATLFAVMYASGQAHTKKKKTARKKKR